MSTFVQPLPATPIVVGQPGHALIETQQVEAIRELRSQMILVELIPGPTGDPGEPGVAGAKGDTGSAGIKGDTGVAGIQGIQGLQGVAGEKGDTGATGATGSSGGAKGDKGDTGATGAAGVNGTNGIDGIDGKSAFQRYVDLTSYAGTETQWYEEVLEGSQGPVGPSGGEKGDQGDQGIQGAKGDTGLDGINGTNGTNGVDGVAGTNGQSAYDIAVDDGFIGTELQWIESLHGLDGAKGDTGNTGIKGDTGDDGIDGAPGAKGDKGDKGDTGLAGSNGIDGIDGTDGLDGAVGATGATGAKGDAGVAGAKGDTGLTGAAGTNGLDGATGAKGDQGIQGIQGAKGDTGLDGATGAALVYSSSSKTLTNINQTIVFTVPSNHPFGVGDYIKVVSKTNINVFAIGYVTAVSSTTVSFTIQDLSSDLVAHAQWILSYAYAIGSRGLYLNDGYAKSSVLTNGILRATKPTSAVGGTLAIDCSFRLVSSAVAAGTLLFSMSDISSEINIVDYRINPSFPMVAVAYAVVSGGTTGVLYPILLNSSGEFRSTVANSGIKEVRLSLLLIKNES